MNVCCKCHVEEGNPPASWHESCLKSYYDLSTTKPPKFKKGDKVIYEQKKGVVDCRDSTLEEAKEHSYGIGFEDGGYLAWIDEDELIKEVLEELTSAN